MLDAGNVREGQVLTGPLFSEPMRVETVTPNGPSAWTIGAVGTQTERFRRVALTDMEGPAVKRLVHGSCVPSLEGEFLRAPAGRLRRGGFDDESR